MDQQRRPEQLNDPVIFYIFIKKITPMKNIFLVLFLFAATLMYGQKISTDNVPDAVKTAFKQKFPDAQKVKWEMDYDDFEAEFISNKKEISAKFSKEGVWIETETPIKPSVLPAEIKDFLSKNFAGFVVNAAETLDTATKGMMYELEIKKGELEYEILVSDKAKLISRTEIDKDKNKKAKTE